MAQSNTHTERNSTEAKHSFFLSPSLSHSVCPILAPKRRFLHPLSHLSISEYTPCSSDTFFGTLGRSVKVVFKLRPKNTEDPNCRKADKQQFLLLVPLFLIPQYHNLLFLLHKSKKKKEYILKQNILSSILSLFSSPSVIFTSKYFVFFSASFLTILFLSILANFQISLSGRSENL